MIFVTLGSQKFQFNRLLCKIDELITEGVISEPVYAQIGYSDYKPTHYQYRKFMDRDEFIDMEIKCDIVVTHGGTGAIIGAVKNGKKVIAIPRMAKYGEHVDDHQIQLLKQFDEMGIIEACYEVGELENAILRAKSKIYRPYISNTQSIIASIDNVLSHNAE